MILGMKGAHNYRKEGKFKAIRNYHVKLNESDLYKTIISCYSEQP